MTDNRHWYQPPPAVCLQCGEEAGHRNHLRRCQGVFSFGPGFAFCQLAEGHTEPHLAENWDGSMWEVDIMQPDEMRLAEGSYRRVGEGRP